MKKNIIVKALDYVMETFNNYTSINPGTPRHNKDEISQGQRAAQNIIQASQNSTSSITSSDEKVKILRNIANESEILRSVIDMKKNQISKFEYNIINSKNVKDNNNLNKRREKYIDFFNSFNKIDDFSVLIRKMTEEICVVDRIALEPIYSMDGKIEYFNLIDAMTIKLIIDGTGRLNICSKEREDFYFNNPMERVLIEDCAYQQIINGQVVKNFTYNQLIVKNFDQLISNPLHTNSLVNKCLKAATISMMKDVDIVKYMKDGNLSNILIGTDTTKDYTPSQLEQYQEFMNKDLRKKNILKIIPWKLDLFETKRIEMKTELDDFIARRICATFGVSPQSFVNDSNRSTAQVASKNEIEYAKTFLSFFENLFNLILTKYFNETELKFSFSLNQEVDEKTKAQIYDIYIKNNVMKINEVRVSLGLSELTDEEIKNINQSNNKDKNSIQAQEDNRNNANDQELDLSKIE